MGHLVSVVGRTVILVRPERLLRRLRSGNLANVSFPDFQGLIEALGFEVEGIRGSHHIYRRRDHAARLNVQPIKGQAKPYQIRQLLALVEQYDLKLEG
jgi:predicted RNA binding protein YcfA (HicA-like mRNA interferase family)